MLTKFLFTLAVIIGVVIFFRHRRHPADGAADGLPDFNVHRHVRHRPELCRYRVISDGAATDYRAPHKSVKGRNFITLDGARITLGENDRIEMIEPR